MIGPILSDQEISHITADFSMVTGYCPGNGIRLNKAIDYLDQVILEFIPDLTIEKFFRKFRHPFQNSSPSKPEIPLHGIVEVIDGLGIIGINDSDPPNEQVFTLAHELAHYLIEQMVPEKRMDQCKEKLKLVGRRAIDKTHIMDHLIGILRNLEVAPLRHYLTRGNLSGEQYLRIAHAETNADRLAFELLAPFSELIGAVDSGSYVRTREKTYDVLVNDFHFPMGPANHYSGIVAERLYRGPSIKEWLKIE